VLQKKTLFLLYISDWECQSFAAPFIWIATIQRLWSIAATVHSWWQFKVCPKTWHAPYKFGYHNFWSSKNYKWSNFLIEYLLSWVYYIVLWKKLFDGTFLSNKKLYDGTIPSNKKFSDGTMLSNNGYFFNLLFASILKNG
jgi:hypothetical protein